MDFSNRSKAEKALWLHFVLLILVFTCTLCVAFLRPNEHAYTTSTEWPNPFEAALANSVLWYVHEPQRNNTDLVFANLNYLWWSTTFDSVVTLVQIVADVVLIDALAPGQPQRHEHAVKCTTYWLFLNIPLFLAYFIWRICDAHYINMAVGLLKVGFIWVISQLRLELGKVLCQTGELAADPGEPVEPIKELRTEHPPRSPVAKGSRWDL